MARAGYIKEEKVKHFDVIHTVKSLAVSYVLSVVLLFLLSIFATVWDMENSAVNICITIITCISVVFCGFLTARGTGRGGLLNGVLAGVLYTLFLYLFGSLAIGSIAFNFATVIALLLGIICGGLGGVLGVNTKRRRR